MEKEFRELTVKTKEEANVILVGIPYDGGCSCGSGASQAPKTIRELSSYLPPFTMDGSKIDNINIFDYGDIEIVSDYYEEIEKKAKTIFSFNKFPLFIGGDHSVSISLEKAFLEHAQNNNKIPVIIHIDAHPDICDFYDNSYYSHACPNMRAIDNGYLPENIVLIGIRGYEEQEVKYLNNHPELKVYQASFLNDGGFSIALEEIKKRFANDQYAIYLSYDIDANDPSFAPGTGTPEAFGLNSYKLMLFIKELFISLPIEAMDLVEVSPQLDNNNITSWLALKTIYEMFKIIGKRGNRI